MRYKIVRSHALDRDFELIFDHLVESYLSFYPEDSNAFERASTRIQDIHSSMEKLCNAPHQGTLRPEFGQDVRQVTKDKSVFYFTVHEDVQEIRVLAVFYGGQDHQRHMLKRLMKRGEGDQ